MGIVADSLADLVRTLPFPLIRDEPGESPRQCIRGIVQDGQSELLDPLSGEAVCFAPEGEADVRLGIMASPGGGGVVGVQVRSVLRNVVSGESTHNDGT